MRHTNLLLTLTWHSDSMTLDFSSSQWLHRRHLQPYVIWWLNGCRTARSFFYLFIYLFKINDRRTRGPLILPYEIMITIDHYFITLRPPCPRVSLHGRLQRRQPTAMPTIAWWHPTSCRQLIPMLSLVDLYSGITAGERASVRQMPAAAAADTEHDSSPAAHHLLTVLDTG